jgi:CHAT domain-containing protein
MLAVPQMLPEWLDPTAVTHETKERDAGSLLLVGAVDYAADPQPAAGSSRPTESLRQAASDEGVRDFPPLPGTAREIESVARISRQFRAAAVDVLSQAAATEEAVRRQAPTHRYLHLATHGFFAPPQVHSAFTAVMGDPRVPSAPVLTKGTLDRTISGFHPGLLSGLVLAGANRGPAADATGTLRDDGILTASEMASLDLRGADLVVLSACETGLGPVAGGEGVLGLQRALQVSGARTVIASLWRVRDAATEALMSEFYRNLWDRKLGKLESLRQAQLTILHDFDAQEGKLRPSNAGKKKTAKDPGRLPPQYWAAFVLSGDWR